jgi:hypothetical protein
VRRRSSTSTASQLKNGLQLASQLIENQQPSAELEQRRDLHRARGRRRRWATDRYSDAVPAGGSVCRYVRPELALVAWLNGQPERGKGHARVHDLPFAFSVPFQDIGAPARKGCAACIDDPVDKGLPSRGLRVGQVEPRIQILCCHNVSVAVIDERRATVLAPVVPRAYSVWHVAGELAGIRTLVDAWNRGDVDQMLSLMSEAVEILSFLLIVEGGYRGHDGVRRWWQNFHEAFPDWHAEISKLRSADEATVARLRLRGHGRASSAPVDQVMWHSGVWRDGKAVRVSAHRTEAEAVKAVGLSE